MAKVLAVDDEPQILTALGRGLTRAGHDVIVARNGEDGLAAAAAASPDVVLLDLRLPDLDGIEVVKRLRAWTAVPIVLLSGSGSERARVLALDAGADDFIDKPFSMEELRARLGAILRRSGTAAVTAIEQPTVQVGDLAVDLSARRVRVAGEEVRLTPLQWKLLEVLVANPGKLLTYRDIIAAVWSDKHGDEARDSLRVHLRALRQKLGDDASAPRYVATEAGVGYRWLGSDE
ncbi:response regulator transcription factor [Egicoccus halophilus]|uniref:DNA-binding response regulator n=1 Tax=Egicoccus halophilus TaxID=1670830 RepID=A0A8J3ES70_9ACTN|nr:response regulator transcription factor [Egicoccus halophilus]GGI06671.1 DNA-binding response regulator [Egicoccus halophilus]